MRNVHHIYIKTFFVFTVCFFSFSNTIAQSASSAEKLVSCIPTSSIKQIDILGNSNVVFQTGVNNFYLNTLPRVCNGLKLSDSITYSTSINRLCNVDVITVLNNAGRDFQTGPSCGLGYFASISKEEIKELKNNLMQHHFLHIS